MPLLYIPILKIHMFHIPLVPLYEMSINYIPPIALAI